MARDISSLAAVFVLKLHRFIKYGPRTCTIDFPLHRAIQNGRPMTILNFLWHAISRVWLKFLFRKGKKEKESFRSKGSEEGQAASLAETAAGTPPLSIRPREACPLSRLVERAETRAEGGVPAGNEAVRGAGPSAQKTETELR